MRDRKLCPLYKNLSRGQCYTKAGGILSTFNRNVNIVGKTKPNFSTILYTSIVPIPLYIYFDLLQACDY